VVEGDRGSECEEATGDPGAEAVECPRAGSFQGQEVCAGPEDALDALTDWSEVCSASGLVGAAGAVIAAPAPPAEPMPPTQSEVVSSRNRLRRAVRSNWLRSSSGRGLRGLRRRRPVLDGDPDRATIRQLDSGGSTHSGSLETQVRWPVDHRGAGADIHAVNWATSPASPEQCGRGSRGRTPAARIYSNAHRVHHLEDPWPGLGLGSCFSRVTFGAPIITTVTEYEPYERLAWTGTGRGARGHHAWLLQPAHEGAARSSPRRPSGVFLRPVLQPVVRRAHQRWVDALAATAPQRSAA
jgi:hypothetical protein